MHTFLTVREGSPSGAFRTFAICNCETQEPIAGFDNIIGNEREVIDYAKRLSLLESWDDVNALQREIEKRSSQIQFDIYGPA